MPIFGNYGNNNLDGRKVEGIILGILLREWKASIPWLSFDRLKDGTKAGAAAFLPLALEFLLRKHFVINNIKNEYRITSTGILSYNDRVDTKTLI
ncbi:hypothetical protein BH23THE1_BH23THE1_22960 [soil metagenome]